MTQLRDYQVYAIRMLDAAVADGARSPLLVLPTGAGKTVVAASLIRRAVNEGKRALFLAPRRELVTQTCDKLRDFGVAHGAILAGADELRRSYEPMQVASIDTLLSRMIRATHHRLEMPPFDLVIVDEAHLSITDTRRRLLDLWPNALRIGLTATPTRKDGRALGVLYDRLIEPTTTAKLTAEGFLAPARYFSIADPDLHKVRTVAGDFNQHDLSAVMNSTQLVGDIVVHWLTHAAERRTVVFCCSIAHSVAVMEAFQRAGVAAEHVDASTPAPDRAATFARFANGSTQVLTNCFLASYGFDLPALSCVVLARPTRSLMLYLQMLGRGLRIADGKHDCLVLDHAGAVHRHGFAADERTWTLDGEHALVAPEAKTVREAAECKLIDCPECSAVFSGTRTCPECGYYLAPRGKEIITIAGDLVEVGEHLPRDQQDLLAFFLELRGMCHERGWKPGAAAMKFKERTGAFPPWQWNDFPIAEPTLATRRWLKSREIAWRKSRVAA